MRIKYGAAAAGIAAAAIGLAAPTHADDEYVGMAIYDPVGPNVYTTHASREPNADAALADAMSECNQKYPVCEPVGTSTQCIAIYPGTGTNWSWATGPDTDTAIKGAEANIVAAGQNGVGNGEPVGHCAWDG